MWGRDSPGFAPEPRSLMPLTEILALEGVDLSYRIDGHDVPVLRGVDLRVREGEFVLIQGELGAGKSALVNVLAGLERPSDGRVRLGGIDGTNLDDLALRRLHESFVGFFAPWFRLDARATLTDLLGDCRRAPRFDPEHICALLGLDLYDGRCFGNMDALTRRRADCARVLMSAPRVIVADLVAPPWGSPPLLDDLITMHRELGLTVVATVERDPSLRQAHLFRLEAGTIVDQLACA